MTAHLIPAISNLYDLTGRVALITGAGAGFGAAIALGFAEYDCDVVCAHVNLGTAQRTASDVEKRGRKSLPLHMYVGDPGQIQEGFRKISQRFGRLDILVNSAGISPHEPAEDTRIETWNQG